MTPRRHLSDAQAVDTARRWHATLWRHELDCKAMLTELWLLPEVTPEHLHLVLAKLADVRQARDQMGAEPPEIPVAMEAR